MPPLHLPGSRTAVEVAPILVARPVGESLVMAALGLFVAIPAVLGCNAVSRFNRGTMNKLFRFRHELHAFLMSRESRSSV